jgi:3',5'-cyclic-AMP phosphodiesterase
MLSSMVKIVQLSDTHLDGQPFSRGRMAALADRLDTMPTQPEVLIVSGDITEPHPDVSVADEFTWLDGTLGREVPVFYAPGNSDDAETFRKFLDSRGDPWSDAGGQTHQVRTAGGVTFLLLDSTVPGEFYGRLLPESITWLRETLAQLDDDARAVIVLHHHPLPLGHPVVDTLRLLDAAEFEQVVATSAAVIATWCGHTHAAFTTTFGGKPLVGAPGVHSSGQLPLEYTEPNSGLINHDSPPAFAVHLVDGRRVTTYFEVCPT